MSENFICENINVNEAGHLTFAGYDTAELAGKYGTALMVMDESVIRGRCREYKTAMEAYLPAGSHPLYASKALSFKRVYEIAREEGMGVDVVSAGELYTAARADFPMEKVYFHGNSKTDRDITYAMDNHIGCFVCDSAIELDAIDREAGRRGIRQRVLLRLTPGIDPHTHEKINTGRIDSKFGAAIETGQAEELILLTYDNTSGITLGLSVVTTLWSASRGVYGLLTGLNAIYEADENRGYFFTRSVSVGYTFALLLVLLLQLVLLLLHRIFLRLLLLIR